MPPTRPFNTVAAAHVPGIAWLRFGVTYSDAHDNIDGGNAIATMLINNGTSHGHVSIVDPAGNTVKVTIPSRQYVMCAARRIRSTGSTIAVADFQAAVPYLLEEVDSGLAAPAPIEVAVGAGLGLDLDAYGSLDWVFDWATASDDTAVATVTQPDAMNVFSVTGVAAGDTEIVATATWFAGPTILRIPVTVTA